MEFLTFSINKTNIYSVISNLIIFFDLWEYLVSSLGIWNILPDVFTKKCKQSDFGKKKLQNQKILLRHTFVQEELPFRQWAG